MSPKIIQQHVFNSFNDKLKSYQHHDITLSTKIKNTQSIANMIKDQLRNKPINNKDPFFNVGQEDLVAFKRRKKFQETYVKAQVLKEMKDEALKQVI